MSVARRSPVHDRLEALGARFVERDGMPVAVSLGEGDSGRARTLVLADFSHSPRVGFKGPEAPAWVQQQSLALPPPNGWTPLAGGGLLARLATSEFLLEGAEVGRVQAALRARPAGVYPVLRQDASFAVAGERLDELLAATCNVNFRAAPPAQLVMTLMVGVSVLAIRDERGPTPALRLWCDPTMAPYLWDTLAGIAAELGGGPVGIDVLPVASPQAREGRSQ